MVLLEAIALRANPPDGAKGDVSVAGNAWTVANLQNNGAVRFQIEGIPVAASVTAAGLTALTTFVGVEATKFGVLAKAGTPATASALGASLTNNVPRTGAPNVLPDFVNGVVYATDYANLRATIAELCNKVALLELQMKANGFAVT